MLLVAAVLIVPGCGETSETSRHTTTGQAGASGTAGTAGSGGVEGGGAAGTTSGGAAGAGGIGGTGGSGGAAGSVVGAAWSKRFGDLNTESGVVIAIGPDDSVVIAHVETQGSGTPSASSFVRGVERLDASGNILWKKDSCSRGRFAFGEDGVLRFLSVAPSDGAIDVLGTTVSTALNASVIADIDDAGALVSYVVYDPPSLMMDDSYIVSNGYGWLTLRPQGAFIHGWLFNNNGEGDFGGQFVSAYSAEGQELWTRTLLTTKSGNNPPVAVPTQLANGNVLVVGLIYGDTVDFGDGPEPLLAPQVPFLAGNGFLAIYNATGGLLFRRLMAGDAGYCDSLDVLDVSASGEISLLATCHGALDFGGGTVDMPSEYSSYLVKLDAMGGYISSQVLLKDSFPRGAAKGPDGDIWICTNLASVYSAEAAADLDVVPAGGGDVVLAHFDSDGGRLSAQLFGDGSTEYCSGLKLTAGGIPVVYGRFYGSIDFGQGVLTHEGTWDAFVAKRGP